MTTTEAGPSTNGADQALAELFSGDPIDPYPLYNQLRETGDGLHFFAPLGGYLAFRYDDVQKMGRENEVFSSNFFDKGPMGIHDPDNSEHLRFINFSSRLLAFNDPPYHTTMRQIVRQGFTPKAVARWRPVVEQAVDNLLGKFQAGDHVDFVEQLAVDMPIDIICAVLGMPVYSREAIRASSSGLQETFEPFILGDQRDDAIRRALSLFDKVGEVIEERRANPTDDLISMVIQTPIEGDQPVEPDDLLAQLMFLLAAGNETTVNLLANGTHLLLENPEERIRLQNDRGLMEAFVEEALRVRPPLHIDPRMTVAPTRLGEQDLPAGTLIFQVLAAANRDPRHFDDPDTFSLDRGRTQHLTFNHGIHRCVGAPLARLEGDVFFNRFLDRFPDFGYGEGRARLRGHHLEARGLESLSMKL